MELNNQTGEPPTGPDKVVRRHKLALVKSSSMEPSPASFGTGRVMFTPAEMRHEFAIWAVKNNADTRAQRHLYYCLRCKQAFSVDDRNGCVTPLDSQGNTLQGSEAIKRLDTFSCGPCPAFSRLVSPRLTAKIISTHAARGRLTELASAGCRAWKAFVAHWHRLPMMDRTSPNVRSKRE